ncbi:sorting nexin-9 isoform X3 [Daktulosphaira vitifoliae]|uniref:sorting nexin-9 isoform X3 n=1 Tax=Daktulosphaira vitifoliae TaxID=58002 RepID=UPI0021A9A88E|nr:sorting nexin-9 isoform X3 [Daktulosphaira vitifoliae]
MIVLVLYDFIGEPGSSELSVIAGEILTVTRNDVGEGWWEGTNSKGQTGLFPAAYVEELKTSKPPGIPPPPLPTSWDDQQNEYYAQVPQTENVDFYDDEWEDESECGTVSNSYPPMGNNQTISSTQSRPDMRSVVAAGMKKNVNRFSTFSKSGGESYIMGTVTIPVPDSERVTIIKCEIGVEWNAPNEYYQCIVASPKKETKLKGLKSFIAYQITPTFNNIQVSRRYKHFDWLHERLEEKFSLIPIPPLPDKQISGRYEENFIERRKNQLQAFVDAVCRHPVLSQCSVWQHFITCTDEKRWKLGKRKAEKSELTGANYFFAIQAPEEPLNQMLLEHDTESFSKFINGLDSAVKNMSLVVSDQSKKMQTFYKREYQKIGQSFYALGHAYGKEEHIGFSRANLTNALKKTGDVYNEIGKLIEEQPKLDWEPFGDMLHIYKGIITSFPDILTVHKGALQKHKECEKLYGENKMTHQEVQNVKERTDVVSYALLSEINHFHLEQNIQLNHHIKLFLKHQIDFYHKIAQNLENVLQLYE